MNRLQHEASLYLRQHANNPVDWYPWGPEALALAKAQDKPIFLSVGYSACHWCHVMEHESFEKETTAGILNDYFISVKVDREERPDIDQLYMQAHGILNRGEGGGWPLSVFLTPDGTPFYAGTYFPPRDNYGRPGFPRLLEAIHVAWVERRNELLEVGNQVKEYLNATQEFSKTDSPLSPEIITKAMKILHRVHDRSHGGFGNAPKFPHALELRLLFRTAFRENAPADANMAAFTLEKMARGGIYDQIGGGFHRYSVDAQWLVPHFEKMLYDNALLVPALLDAYQTTGRQYFARIARETLDYVLKEMTGPTGGFYATQDADSEGEEGKFYVWAKDEIEEILGLDEALLAVKAMGITSQGNFEGHNIPTGVDTETDLSTIKVKLYAHRAKRVWPGRDEKYVTCWNGLMISAFAHAGMVLNEPRYIAAANHAADFVLKYLRNSNGQLFRTSAEGSTPKLMGYLEDSTAMMEALITLFEATGESNRVTVAVELAEDVINRFSDTEHGGFFATANDHEALIARPKDQHDGSVPSGNALAATAFLRLSRLINNTQYRDVAQQILAMYKGLMTDSPTGAGQFLLALDSYFAKTSEVVVVAGADESETEKVVKHHMAKYDPYRMIILVKPGQKLLPVAEGKPAINNTVTSYICRNFQCEAPVVGVPTQ